MNNGNKNRLEATVVKIVKEKTEVSHADLVKIAADRVSKRFVPDKELVEKCIVSMLEMDYIAKSFE